jgi:hypothetical protein
MSDAGDGQQPDGVSLTFSHGERGRALGYTDGVLKIVCERAHPPGQPLSLALQLPEGELALQGKSAGSKRRDDGGFDLRLKLNSLRREHRAALEQHFG